MTQAKGGLEFIVAMGWHKSTIDEKPFWTFDVSDTERLDAIKAARTLIDQRKELQTLKIEGAVKALEQVTTVIPLFTIQEKKDREAREQAVRDKFVTDREEFNETQELRGGVKDSVANIPVKENPIFVRQPGQAEEHGPPSPRDLLGAGMRLDEEEQEGA